MILYGLLSCIDAVGSEFRVGGGITTALLLARTAMSLAKTKGHTACVALLEEAMKQVCEEACASDYSESIPAVEGALRFYAESGDEARLAALLECRIVNVMSTSWLQMSTDPQP